MLSSFDIIALRKEKIKAARFVFRNFQFLTKQEINFLVSVCNKLFIKEVGSLLQKLADGELLRTSRLASTALDATARLSTLCSVFIIKVICLPKIELRVIVHARENSWDRNAHRATLGAIFAIGAGDERA